jgi:hypothetical protein
MQDTAVPFTQDASLQKELLSEAHVAVGEDEWGAVALDFIMQFHPIRCSDKRHGTFSFTDVYQFRLL